MASTTPSSLQDISPDTLARFREVVAAPVSFDSPAEEAACQEIVASLTEEEINAVANISYSFWALTKLGDDAASPEVARKIASKIARWHLQYLGGKDVKGAVKRLQDVIQIRKDRNMELLRTCFDKEGVSPEGLEVQKNISEDIHRQLQFFRGQDKSGGPVLIKIPRIASGTSESAYITQQLFSAEKAVAVGEFLSKGTSETATAVFSMKNQNSSYTPSLSWQLGTIKMLQTLFPGRIGCLIILDAPFMIRGIFNSIKPFLSAGLRDSTFMLAGKAATDKLEEVLGDGAIFDDEGGLRTAVDVQKYLHETPFYCPYEYEM